MNENNLNHTNNKQFLKTLVTIALPIALQSLVGSSLSLVDNLMVGSLGEAELHAVGVAIQIFFIHWMLLFGFTSGCGSYLAQFFGAGDFINIRKTIGFALTVTVSVSLLFFIVGMFFPQYVLKIFTKWPEIASLGESYIRMGAGTFLFLAVTVPLASALRATQQTKLPFYISGIAFITNTILNYLFIFGNFGAPKLGVTGAALATLIARFVEMALMVYVVFGRRNVISGKLTLYFGYSKAFAVRLVKNAIPTTVNETMWSLGTALYIAAFSRIGETEGAAIQACNTINNLFIMAAFSIGDAALILLGQKLGQGRLDEAYQLSKKLIKVGIIIGITAGGGLILFGKPLLTLFEFTPRGEQLAFYILIVYGSLMWLSIYNGLNITGILRCGGDTKFAMAAETLTVWCIGVPMAFITALFLKWPIFFAVLAVKSEEIVKGIVLTKRFFSKKWVKNIVSDLKEH